MPVYAQDLITASLKAGSFTLTKITASNVVVAVVVVVVVVVVRVALIVIVVVDKVVFEGFKFTVGVPGAVLVRTVVLRGASLMKGRTVV